MSKYIIDLDYGLQRVVGVGVKQGTVWVKDYDVDDLEELCADYINEHFGDLQDTAYKRGFEDGKEVIHKGCEGCKYEPIKGGTCVMCCNNYKNQWTAKKQDDEIKVGDEVRWGMDLIVITRLYMDGGFKWCDGISKYGIAFHVLEENVSKTNRHFDIAKILEEMKA